LTDGNMRKNVQ